MSYSSHSHGVLTLLAQAVVKKDRLFVGEDGFSSIASLDKDVEKEFNFRFIINDGGIPWQSIADIGRIEFELSNFLTIKSIDGWKKEGNAYVPNTDSRAITDAKGRIDLLRVSLIASEVGEGTSSQTLVATLYSKNTDSKGVRSSYLYCPVSSNPAERGDFTDSGIMSGEGLNLLLTNAESSYANQIQVFLNWSQSVPAADVIFNLDLPLAGKAVSTNEALVSDTDFNQVEVSLDRSGRSKVGDGWHISGPTAIKEGKYARWQVSAEAKVFKKEYYQKSIFISNIFPPVAPRSDLSRRMDTYLLLSWGKDQDKSKRFDLQKVWLPEIETLSFKQSRGYFEEEDKPKLVNPTLRNVILNWQIKGEYSPGYLFRISIADTKNTSTSRIVPEKEQWCTIGNKIPLSQITTGLNSLLPSEYSVKGAVDIPWTFEIYSAQNLLTPVTRKTLHVSHIYTEIYVDKEAKGRNNGTSWENAFTEIDDALAAVKERMLNYDCCIYLTEGTYETKQDFDFAYSVNLSIKGACKRKNYTSEPAYEGGSSRSVITGKGTVITWLMSYANACFQFENLDFVDVRLELSHTFSESNAYNCIFRINNKTNTPDIQLRDESKIEFTRCVFLVHGSESVKDIVCSDNSSVTFRYCVWKYFDDLTKISALAMSGTSQSSIVNFLNCLFIGNSKSGCITKEGCELIYAENTDNNSLVYIDYCIFKGLSAFSLWNFPTVGTSSHQFNIFCANDTYEALISNQVLLLYSVADTVPKKWMSHKTEILNPGYNSYITPADGNYGLFDKTKNKELEKNKIFSDHSSLAVNPLINDYIDACSNGGVTSPASFRKGNPFLRLWETYEEGPIDEDMIPGKNYPR